MDEFKCNIIADNDLSLRFCSVHWRASRLPNKSRSKYVTLIWRFPMTSMALLQRTWWEMATSTTTRCLHGPGCESQKQIILSTKCIKNDLELQNDVDGCLVYPVEN